MYVCMYGVIIIFQYNTMDIAIYQLRAFKFIVWPEEYGVCIYVCMYVCMSVFVWI